MKMRLSEKEYQDPTMHALKLKNAQDKKIFLNVWCNSCGEVLPYQQVTRQLQELSFYSFLE